MLDQNERTWRNCFSLSSGAGGRIAERDDVVDGSTSTDGLTAVQDREADLRSCPVCEFASAEYNDVYDHLMTAHRKSKISAMLLETR